MGRSNQGKVDIFPDIVISAGNEVSRNIVLMKEGRREQTLKLRWNVEETLWTILLNFLKYK